MRPVRLWMAAAAAGLLLWGAPAQADFAAGYAAFQSGAYKEAMSTLRPLAEAGDKRAQFLVGHMYLEGLGRRKSARQAFEWLSRAADGADADRFALHDLAVLYERGEGTKRDRERAAALYEQAAARGVPASMLNLGVMRARGQGVKRDLGAGLRLIYRAFEAGHPGAAAQFDTLARGAGGDPPLAGRWRAVDYHGPADDPALNSIEEVGRLALGTELRLGRRTFRFGRLSCRRPVFLADGLAAELWVAGSAGATASAPYLDVPSDAAAGVRTVEVVCERALFASFALLPDGRVLAPAFGGYLVMEPSPSDRVEAVQQRLAALGYDPGRPDGVYGRRTAEAIRAYQGATGLPASGALTEALLASLGDQSQPPSE